MDQEIDVVFELLTTLKVVGGALKSKGNGQPISDKKLSQWRDTMGGELREKLGDGKNYDDNDTLRRDIINTVAEMQNAMRPTFEYEHQTVETLKEFIENFFKKNGISTDFDPFDPHYNPAKVFGLAKTDKMERIALMEIAEYNEESKYWAEGKKQYSRMELSKDNFKTIFDGMPIKIMENNKQKVADALRFDIAYADASSQWLNHSLKHIGAQRSLDVVMLQQWMWQVKRYMYGMVVQRPYFINVLGPQGSGKSEFIRGLYTPLRIVTADQTMDILKDMERNAHVFADNLIVYFDEMQIDKSKDSHMWSIMATFKFVLTTDILNSRTFFKQEGGAAKRTFSGIGTSNQPLNTIIYDDSGMRRFYEIVTDIDVKQEYFRQIPYVKDTDPTTARAAVSNYITMWKGIDENREGGYLDSKRMAELTEVQQSYAKPDCIDLYNSYVDSPVELISKHCDKAVQVNAVLSLEHKSMSDLEDNMYNIQVDILKVPKYRNGMVTSLKAMDADSGKFVYSAMRMTRELKLKGYIVHRFKNADLVFIDNGIAEEVVQPPVTNVPPPPPVPEEV